MFYQSQRMSPYIKGLIIANVAVFVLQMMPVIGDAITIYGAIIPKNTFEGFQLWRLATYMFLHSPDMLFHILFNMLALWWFGTELEDIWGGKKFLIFYFVCGIGSGLFSVFYYLLGLPVLVIGASGAVLGVLTAYAHYYPSRQVLLFFIFPMKIRTLVIGYAAISILLSLRGGGGVAHIVHLGGIAIAWLYLRMLPMLQARTGRWVYRMKKRKRML